MTPARPRIVVTGFGPWGQARENPSLLVLDRLRENGDLPGDLTTLAFPVETAAVAPGVARALDEIRPDLWVGLGLALGAPVVAVERLAANVLDFAVPDNAGTKAAGEPVVPGAPAAYLATLPVAATVRALRAAGIPARLSNSASTYLCNQLMYTVLHAVATRGLATRAGFLHLPAHPALAAAHPGPDMPSMGIDLMADAVRVAVRTALAGE